MLNKSYKKVEKCRANKCHNIIPQKNFVFFTFTEAHKTLIKQPKKTFFLAPIQGHCLIISRHKNLNFPALVFGSLLFILFIEVRLYIFVQDFYAFSFVHSGKMSIAFHQPPSFNYFMFNHCRDQFNNCFKFKYFIGNKIVQLS